MTKIIKLDPKNPDIEEIRLAARTLKGGGIVAFPTETVYGLGANRENHDAVRRIYEIKKRPEEKPLTVHIADLDKLDELVGEAGSLAEDLIGRFWPGPLTLILNSKEGTTVGVRMPKGAISTMLIKESGVFVVAPSANISGENPAFNAEQVKQYFNGLIDIIIDGGQCEERIASTVVDVSSLLPRVLREGAISREDLGVD